MTFNREILPGLPGKCHNR